MERNRWETAIRCLEVAVHPNTSNDEVIAAVNGFRRTADGTPLSQVCAGVATVPVPLADQPMLKDKLDELNRENLELRRKLAIEEAAQASTARCLDAAFRRVHELTGELAAAQYRAETAEQEFAAFRAVYARIIDSVNHDKFAIQTSLDEAQRRAAQRPTTPAATPSFARYLSEARFGNGPGTPFPNGSGRLPTAEPDPSHPWTA
jgi:hypothetical protein